MIVLVGKTCSGKTVLLQELKNFGWKSITTYTTRKRRENEPEDAYHFISEEEFLEKMESGFFAEYSIYETVFGKAYYGSAKADYENTTEKKAIILNPYGLKAVLKNKIEVTAIYLNATEQLIQQRLLKRNDNQKEAKRRLESDEYDFRDIERYCDLIINVVDDFSTKKFLDILSGITEQ